MRSPRHVSNDVVQAAVGITIAIVLSQSLAIAQTASPGPRELPARTIPVPETVSPQMQKLIAAPLSPDLERDSKDAGGVEGAGQYRDRCHYAGLARSAGGTARKGRTDDDRRRESLHGNARKHPAGEPRPLCSCMCTVVAM